MWQHLLNAGMLKDVGVFAGAYMAIQAVQRFRTSQPNPVFDEYPYVKAFGYVQILTPLVAFVRPLEMRNLNREVNRFLESAATGSVRQHGFETNRMGNELLEQVRASVNVAKRDVDTNVALLAMDFERDELPILEGMVDDTIRNMLLAG